MCHVGGQVIRHRGKGRLRACNKEGLGSAKVQLTCDVVCALLSADWVTACRHLPSWGACTLQPTAYQSEYDRRMMVNYTPCKYGTSCTSQPCLYWHAHGFVHQLMLSYLNWKYALCIQHLFCVPTGRCMLHVSC